MADKIWPCTIWSPHPDRWAARPIDPWVVGTEAATHSPVGYGNTPDEALADLTRRMREA